jgi:SP family arabinose:H+ symporter-like MFS transporter
MTTLAIVMILSVICHESVTMKNYSQAICMSMNVWVEVGMANFLQLFLLTRRVSASYIPWHRLHSYAIKRPVIEPAHNGPENRARTIFLLSAVLTAALGGVLFGFDIAIITGAGPFLKTHFGLSDIGLGWAFSSLLFGCVLGSLVTGRLADRYGRRKALLWAAVLFGATSVLTATAPSFPFFILARTLGGLAVGAVSILSPMYIAEIAPPESRGRLGALYQMSVVTGILLSYLTNYKLRDAGADNWRWMFLTGVFPAIVFFGLLLRAPEPPRYLLMAGKVEQAREILTRIVDPEFVALEFDRIRASFVDRKHDWSDLLRPGIRRAVGVSFGLAILVHISGVNTVIDYAPSIFQSAGWQIDAALFATFLVGVTNFVFTLVSFWMIDRWGRKPLYVTGSLVMAATLVGLALLSVMGAFHGKLVPLLVMAYLAFFASCIGPVFWTLMPEIFPNHIRGTAMTVPVLTQWVANATVVLFFPLAFNRLGKSITFGFLAAMALLQAIFMWIYVPETKNKSLEEIEEFWKLQHR